VITVFRGNSLKSFRYVHAVLLGLTCFLSVTCQRVSSTEEKVVGTWEYTGFDSHSRIAFRRDHIVVVLIPADGDDFNARHWMPASWGKWRVDGNTIIVNNEQVYGLDGPRWTGEVDRLPIREFHENRLVSDDDGSTWNRLSAARQRYARLLSSFYLLASLAAIASMIVAMRKAVVWKEVILFAIAAIGVLSLSMLALLGELGETGSLVISPRLMKWLQVPNDVLKVGFVTILIIAVARIGYRIRQTGKVEIRDGEDDRTRL
jgi:hypothetical protein